MSYDLKACQNLELKFIYRDNDPEMKAVEDEIRADLAKIGIKLDSIAMDGATFWESDTLASGDYNIRFARTWGAPYDPHSYITSWTQVDSPTYNDHANLAPPLTRDALVAKIERVQTLIEEQLTQSLWREILDDIHQQATVVPLWGNRIPYVINRRLQGFSPGAQILAFPLETIRVASGSKNVTLNGGDDGNFFESAGSLNPFLYSNNRFYITDWIFEGLVGYEDDGEIYPVLASSWAQEKTDEGQKITFTLREGVKFHDGSDWNCSVAKLNFDHVLSEGIRERHSWYGTARFLSNWTCDAEGRFVLETDRPFYPLLQELTYIRPLVFASANSFAFGFDSHPELHNSCDDPAQEDVTCLGLKAPIGTGPFKYIGREYLPGDETIDAKVMFSRNENYWGTVADIEFVELRYYPDNNAVYDALMSGDLDMAMGIGPLTPLQVQEIKFNHSDRFHVHHSEVTQNSLLIMNTAKAPTDDINVRKAIIHALDKAFFVEKEFAGLEQPASQLMPVSLPFCDLDLTPKWSYDFVKAASLNCQVGDELSGGAIAGIVISASLFVALLSLLLVMIRREKSGKPIFSAEKMTTAENA